MEEEEGGDHLHAEEAPIQSPPSPTTPLAPAVGPGRTGEGGDRSIFRFSSSGSGGSRSALKFKSKKKGVSTCGLQGGKAKVVRGFIKRSVEQGKSGGGGGRKRVPSVRRVSLLFKKRKTSKNCSGKRDLTCSSDSPSFGWGLGIGIMYMMSAGKEEISKLNHAVDETAKVVHELKAELHRRRSRHRQSSSSFSYEAKLRSNGCIQVMEQMKNELGRKVGPSDTQAFSTPSADDGEHASSILTEELHPEGTDMDQMEADLESELQKLPSFVDQASDEGGITRDCGEDRALHEPECRSLTSFQSHGVSPTVLSEKLSDLLIKQQESHISELEFELKSASSKLQEREAELQALKDCVKRLTEFSLSSASDEETEACKDQSLIIK